MSVVGPSQLNRPLGSLSQSHPCSTASAKDAFIGNFVLLWLAAKSLRGDLLQLFLRIHRCRVGSACHRVCGLAAPRYTSEGKVLRRVSPRNLALFPGNAKNFCTGAVDVDHRLGSEVANP